MAATVFFLAAPLCRYAHGISNRLTGGPSNTGCLGSGEAGGMGEGWGDCYSLAFRWRAEYDTNTTVIGMGEYAAGDGIRVYPYARNMTINPQTYSYINGAQYNGVHAKGALGGATRGQGGASERGHVLTRALTDTSTPSHPMTCTLPSPAPAPAPASALQAASGARRSTICT